MTSEPSSGADSVLIVGAGLIGTSIGLALSRGGSEVWLADLDSRRVDVATHMGAGRPHGGAHVGLVVVAAPPSSVPQVVCDALRSLPDAVVTDTASVKSAVQRGVEAALLGDGDGSTAVLARFVGGHPIAGSEHSGPEAARADLFAGRPWALTPSRASSDESVRRVRRLVERCGATTVRMGAEEHDDAVARTSHAPQVLSSALAAEFADQPDDVLAVAGMALQDMTRIAASDPDLWTDILVRNAEPVAAVLERLGQTLQGVARDVRGASNPPALRALLEAGRIGRARISGVSPAAHGGLPPPPR